MLNQQEVLLYKNKNITFGQCELTRVCKQLIAASATSLLPLNMLFLTNSSKSSHPENVWMKLIAVNIDIRPCSSNAYWQQPYYCCTHMPTVTKHQLNSC
jgi:hypothetical protein